MKTPTGPATQILSLHTCTFQYHVSLNLFVPHKCQDGRNLFGTRVHRFYTRPEKFKLFDNVIRYFFVRNWGSVPSMLGFNHHLLTEKQIPDVIFEFL